MAKRKKIALTFQDVITQLNEFWRERGCLLMQAVDKEVGAGTFHSATFLRALGPEPWACAYTQASRRPFDGRYGRNPNRMQHYYQYQVLIKPPPLEILEIYTDSLASLGINTKTNDIRCVEDNWNSPSLGAWGVGWEIWCNGMEITQFTYFQQVGGIDCDPICCEITYGLERIAMYLQNVRNVFDLVWGHDAKGNPIYYRELFQDNERQCSHYNFEYANIESLRQRFEHGQQNIQQLIEAKLPIPAYEQVLDLSHAFNLLEARKALSVIDRQNMILRIRSLACQCAESWLDSREELGFPLGQYRRPRIDASAAVENHSADTQIMTAPADSAEGKDILFEIGVEPLPVKNFVEMRASMLQSINKQLKERQFDCVRLRGIIAPTRIGIYIHGLKDQASVTQDKVLGPVVPPNIDPSDIRALQQFPPAVGFAKSHQATVADLQVDESAKGKRLCLIKLNHPEPLNKFLPTMIDKALQALPIETPMRWGTGNWSFVRPVHWVVFLCGDSVVSASYFGQSAGRTTCIHRAGKRQSIELASARDYFGLMGKYGQSVGDTYENYVLKLHRQIKRLARINDGKANLGASLLSEIAAITSTPKSLLCKFDKKFLELPSELICYVLEHHQRCVTISGENDCLTEKFICISDRRRGDNDSIRAGNEKVVSARLEDAMYFWRNDTGLSLEQWQLKLQDTDWFEGLGSYSLRIERMRSLAKLLAEHNDVDGELLGRSIDLCKIDLCSDVVNEYPELSGIMAGHLLNRLGVDDELTAIVSGHCQPHTAFDPIPTNKLARLCALADRIDALVGLFTRYRSRSSDADPYGIRRVCLAIIRLCLDINQAPSTVNKHRRGTTKPEPLSRLGFPLMSLLQASFDSYVEQGLFEAHQLRLDDLLDFVLKRLNIWHQTHSSVTANVVDAAIGAFASKELNFASIDQRIEQVASLLRDENVNRTILTAYKRIRNIMRDASVNDAAKVNSDLFEHKQEAVLWDWWRVRQEAPRNHFNNDVKSFAALAGLLESFFEVAMVQCEDINIRHNRETLLSRIQVSMTGFADFSRLV